MTTTFNLGDVALVECSDRVWRRAMCEPHPNVATQLVWRFPDRVCRDVDASHAKPLVVIDPEDRMQVARLADAFCTARWSHLSDSDECDPLTRSSMTEALNAYLAPKPTEPTGRYAVVMANGVTWCRAAWASDEPWSRLGTDVFKAWADMDVTSVEFEGLR